MYFLLNHIKVLNLSKNVCELTQISEQEPTVTVRVKIHVWDED